MRILPVNLLSFKAIVVLSDEKQAKHASPLNQDTVDITKKVEFKKGRAEKVQIANTTIYNNADGTQDFVIKNPDGSITLESFDKDGFPIDEIKEPQGE